MSLLVPVFTADQKRVESDDSSAKVRLRLSRSERMSETRKAASLESARRPPATGSKARRSGTGPYGRSLRSVQWKPDRLYIAVHLCMLGDMKDTFLTVAEAAALVRCHPHTIRRWIWSRKLRAVKVGDLVRVPEQELARLVRPTDGRRKQRGRSRKGATALIATMRRLRRSVNPAD